ncbi:MAG: hypothetical protein IKH27_03885 [Oscillospiraceae bacterium]|nr:hypothetical protein [Oscillospiraceae bacterium]MBR3446926.1 hypothetical protein [Oscillospiraceae bacterium]
MFADVLSENGGSFPEPIDSASEHIKPLPAFFNTETPFVTRFYTITLNADGSVQSSSTEFISDVSAQDIERSAAAVLKKGKERGWFGDFRYKLYETDGVRQIIFISNQNHRATAADFMRSTVSIFVLCSLAILGLIIVLSRFVVRSAEESYRKQRQFITDANHELKTPLTLILTNIDIAESELGQNE